MLRAWYIELQNIKIIIILNDVIVFSGPQTHWFLKE